MTTKGSDSLIADLDVSKLVDLIRIAETAERYEDMCTFVARLVELKSADSKDLDVDERNLLSVAFKNVVGAKRASWRTLAAGFDDVDEDLLKQYKQIVETELEAVINQALALLQKHLCPGVKGKGDETEVFYLKMCGDYYRYKCEFMADDDSKTNAEKHYKEAMDVAEANLAETHPTRLGLALNFSVCYYEILKKPEMACDLAKKSFDAAIEKLDTIGDANYKDSTLIMQLLRDNLTLWTSSQDEADEQ